MLLALRSFVSKCLRLILFQVVHLLHLHGLLQPNKQLAFNSQLNVISWQLCGIPCDAKLTQLKANVLCHFPPGSISRTATRCCGISLPLRLYGICSLRNKWSPDIYTASCHISVMLFRTVLHCTNWRVSLALPFTEGSILLSCYLPSVTSCSLSHFSITFLPLQA